MAKVKQVGLLAAGCQPWNKDVCAASGDRFAYCATLAIYIYQVNLPLWSKSQKHVLRPESLEGTDEEDPISALEWDPLSTDYLLVSNLHNGIRLVDSEGLACITSFCFPSAAASVQCLAWVPSAPGMFITGDSQVGVLRVWNVSRSTPLDSFKLKKTGFHALHVLNSPLTKKAQSSCSPSKSQHTSSTSEAVPPPTLSQNRAFSLPPGHAVCCFMDGGVGLYDMGAKKWDFLRDLGHVETIFDCKFKPDDPNLLATASFDGTIKIWDTNTLTAVHTSPGNEGVVYSLSWAPGDLNCIAGATSRNGAFIWDVRKGKIITRFNEHGKNGIFCISWSHKDSKRIATCSGDGFCIIRTIDGKILHKYKHPAAVFGCDWSQNNNLFYVSTVLKFVYWSSTVRIWDYTQDACINVLSGHTAPVRGLMWNTEVPHLLISGSWDYTIRVWDTRDGTCLDTVYDHGADVYGLTCHQSRPFTMASCSRDSTVRLWSLTPLISPLLLNILTEQPWEKIIGNTDKAMVPGSPPLLCGKVSRDIKQELDKLSGNARARKLRWFSECFSPPGGSGNLWDLVFVINGQDDSLLPASYSKGVMHMKHLVKFKTSEAQELTIVKMSKFGGGIGAPSKEERLKEAAQIHLRLGQIQRYCELMVELGEWEKALSVAPGVSMKYWKKLMQRRADQLMAEDNDDAIPYCVATGDIKKLVSFFTSRGQLLEALLIAQGACEGNIRPPPTSSINHTANDVDNRQQYQSLLHIVCRGLADWYFQDGCSVLAACCHLAVDNIQEAMVNLIRGNELELAAFVGLVLGEAASQSTAYCLELLARKYMTPSTWELSVDLLQMIPDNHILLAKLCAFYPGSSAEINQLHERVAHLDTHYNQLLKRREVCVPLKIEQLSVEMDAWRACTQPDCSQPSESQTEEFSCLERRILPTEPATLVLNGADYVTGSNLPSHSDLHLSCFTGHRIQGPVFLLEDNKSAISLNDALMWAKVNPFSPLGTGVRINPF
ncbi:PREDICTED: WD repeat-containing protein 17 [Cyprinodon variegatus]|uniref:WD repeat-containing protein 17 n=1 Tax=Cyprinodon variegatus TaxID=28743 RepID=UPI0007428514|nr:PREDICTED: WD repeat-containing protein 17 [Cyprinodon variegatus]